VPQASGAYQPKAAQCDARLLVARTCRLSGWCLIARLTDSCTPFTVVLSVSNARSTLQLLAAAHHLAWVTLFIVRQIFAALAAAHIVFGTPSRPCVSKVLKQAVRNSRQLRRHMSGVDLMQVPGMKSLPTYCCYTCICSP
jgi:hypothetical protein